MHIFLINAECKKSSDNFVMFMEKKFNVALRGKQMAYNITALVLKLGGVWASQRGRE